MKIRNSKAGAFLLASAFCSLLLVSCDKDDDTAARSQEFNLQQEGNNGVTGKLRVSENADKSFNLRVTLNKSVKDTVHLLRLYNGSLNDEGVLALSLNNITGNGGAVSAETLSIKKLKGPDNTEIQLNYDSILKYNAYLHVLYSATKSDSIISKGNVFKSAGN